MQASQHGQVLVLHNGGMVCGPALLTELLVMAEVLTMPIEQVVLT
jgi:hypothetical protein